MVKMVPALSDSKENEKSIFTKLMDYFKCKSYGGEFLCLECLTPHSALDSINSDYSTKKLNYKRIKDGIKQGFSQSSNITDDSSEFNDIESHYCVEDYQNKIPIILEDPNNQSHEDDIKGLTFNSNKYLNQKINGDLYTPLGFTKKEQVPSNPQTRKMEFQFRKNWKQNKLSSFGKINNTNKTDQNGGSEFAVISEPPLDIKADEINSLNIINCATRNKLSSSEKMEAPNFTDKNEWLAIKMDDKPQFSQELGKRLNATSQNSSLATIALRNRLRDIHSTSAVSDTSSLNKRKNLRNNGGGDQPCFSNLSCEETSSVMTNRRRLMLLKYRFKPRDIIVSKSMTTSDNYPQPYHRLKENYGKAYSYDPPDDDCDIPKYKVSLCSSKSVDITKASLPNGAGAGRVGSNLLSKRSIRDPLEDNKSSCSLVDRCSQEAIPIFVGESDDVAKELDIGFTSTSEDGRDNGSQEPGNESLQTTTIGTLKFYIKYDFPNESLNIKIIELIDFMDEIWNEKKIDNNSYKTSNATRRTEESKFGILKNDTHNICIKFCLLPDQKLCYRTTLKKVSRSTKVSKGSICIEGEDKKEDGLDKCNLYFDENFNIRIPYSEALRRILDISLENADKEKQVVLGNLFLHINAMDIIKGDHISECIKLDYKKSSNLGELLLCLNYLPKAGRLIVDIIKATNLLQTGDLGARDPFVKINLFETTTMVKQKRTTVKRKTLNPTFHESFNFRIRESSDLEDFSLVITVCDNKSRVRGKNIVTSAVGFGSSQIIGRIVFGKYATGPQQMNHWERMLSKNRRNGVAQWQPLLSKVECDATSPISLKC